jgi:hypothetical protein
VADTGLGRGRSDGRRGVAIDDELESEESEGKLRAGERGRSSAGLYREGEGRGQGARGRETVGDHQNAIDGASLMGARMGEGRGETAASVSGAWRRTGAARLGVGGRGAARGRAPSGGGTSRGRGLGRCGAWRQHGRIREGEERGWARWGPPGGEGGEVMGVRLLGQMGRIGRFRLGFLNFLFFPFFGRERIYI